MPPTMATGVTMTLKNGTIIKSATPVPKPSDSARCVADEAPLAAEAGAAPVQRLVERVEGEEERRLHDARDPHERREHGHHPLHDEQRHRDRADRVERRGSPVRGRVADSATICAPRLRRRPCSPVCTCSARSLEHAGERRRGQEARRHVEHVGGRQRRRRRRRARRSRPTRRRARPSGARRTRAPSDRRARRRRRRRATVTRRRQEHERHHAPVAERDAPAAPEVAHPAKEARYHAVVRITYLLRFYSYSAAAATPSTTFPQTDTVKNPALNGERRRRARRVGHPAHLRRRRSRRGLRAGLRDGAGPPAPDGPARHSAAGTLAELLGDVSPALIDSDIQMRVHHFTQTCRRRGRRCRRRRTRRIRRRAKMLTSFAAGVNAYIADLQSQKFTLPPALVFFYDPATIKPWTEVDSLLVGQRLAFELSYDADSDIFRIAARGGGEAAVRRRRRCRRWRRARASATTSRSWRRSIRPTRCRRAGRA